MHKGYFDGACQGNPGKLGLGACVYDSDGTEVICAVSHRPYGTNNDAEYLALILLLQKARKHNIKEMACYGDSKLIINQVNRDFQASDKFKKYIDLIDEIACEFDKISFSWIKRESNKRADKLSKDGLLQHKTKQSSQHEQETVKSAETKAIKISETNKVEAHSAKKKSLSGKYSVSSIDGTSLLVVKGGDVSVVNLKKMSCTCIAYSSNKSCIHIKAVKKIMPKYLESMTALPTLAS